MNRYEITYTVSATRKAFVMAGTAIAAERKLKENWLGYSRQVEGAEAIVSIDEVVLRVDVPSRV